VMAARRRAEIDPQFTWKQRRSSLAVS